MLLFATALECDACIYYVPARRTETYRSVRTPMVHVRASDSSPRQLLSLDSGPARGKKWILGMTVELCGISRLSMSPGSLEFHRVDERLGPQDYVSALA